MLAKVSALQTDTYIVYKIFPLQLDTGDSVSTMDNCIYCASTSKAQNSLDSTLTSAKVII